MNNRLYKGIFLFLGMAALILDSKTAYIGAKEGLDLCLKTIIPSLFPFFVLSNLLINMLHSSDAYIVKYMAGIFSIPRGAEVLLICSFLGGYPVGAQCIGRLYRSKSITKNEAEKLLAYCSNAGPSFIFGMISGLFQERWIPWALWSIHIVSAFFVSRYFSPGEGFEKKITQANMTIVEAVQSAVTIMGQVCAWVLLFRILISFLNRWILWIFPVIYRIILSGALELTNGCTELLNIDDSNLRFIICSVLLAFGGLCVGLQTASVTNGINLKYYFLGKTLQATISLCLSAALMSQNWVLLLIFILLFAIFPRILQNGGSFRKTIRV